MHSIWINSSLLFTVTIPALMVGGVVALLGVTTIVCSIVDRERA